MTTKSSGFFASLGFEVVSEQGGVYCLRALGTERQFVAVLHAASVLTGAGDEVQLLAYELPAGVSPEDVIAHWSQLDARRLAQSGIYPLSVQLTSEQLPFGYLETGCAAEVFQRPNDCGERHMVRLASGELVCYN